MGWRSLSTDHTGPTEAQGVAREEVVVTLGDEEGAWGVGAPGAPGGAPQEPEGSPP